METLLNTVYLSRYRIEALLGEGRNARVYRAYDMVRKGSVALKLYTTDSLDHQTAEAAVQHQLEDCAAVMPLYDVHPEAVPYEATAMRVAVSTLADLTPLPAADVRQHLLRVFTALGYCAGRTIVHGDVKPKNCFVDQYGLVLLGDFGVADFLPEGRRGHTLEYAAPELLAGHPRTPATDVWAALVMLYELLCGELPFGSTADDPEGVVAQRILAGTFAPVASHRPFLPRRLQRLFQHGFVVDPLQRPVATAADAHNQLANIPLRADWVRVSRAGAVELWEGVERDDESAVTGVTYEAELSHLPRARRYEAEVRRGNRGKRMQRWPGARPCTDTSEARARQCMYGRMRAVTEGRAPL